MPWSRWRTRRSPVTPSSIARSRAAGEYVREAGSDLAAGAILLPGRHCGSPPRHLAALAAAGLAEVAVRAGSGSP